MPITRISVITTTMPTATMLQVKWTGPITNGVVSYASNPLW